MRQTSSFFFSSSVSVLFVLGADGARFLPCLRAVDASARHAAAALRSIYRAAARACLTHMPFSTRCWCLLPQYLPFSLLNDIHFGQAWRWRVPLLVASVARYCVLLPPDRLLVPPRVVSAAWYGLCWCVPLCHLFSFLTF
jgi:hypothetical protein